MRSLVIGLLVLVACGGGGGGDDDDDDGGIDAPAPDASPPDAPPGPDAPVGDNSGFVTPTAATTAYDDTGTLVGAADWSCLGTADVTPATTVAVTISGTVGDFQNTDTEIRDATVDVFPGPDPAAAIDSDGPTGVDGAYSLTLAAGTRYWGFRVVEPGNYMETRELLVVFDPATASQQRVLRGVSQGLATALPAFVGLNRTPGLAEGSVRLLDCAGNRVAGAIVTVSINPGVADHLGTTETYYLDDGSSLPVGHGQLAATDSSGTALLFEITPHGSAFFQAWGLTTAGGGLTLLGEARAPIAGDTFTFVDLEPLRTP